jgi:pimeloyl-ACP methyl ester carboxylesterase
VPVVSRTVQAADGRSLTVYEAGDPDGTPVLFHHGTPSSGRPWQRHDAEAEEQGVRLVSYDRAGYGTSDRNVGRAVVDVVGDALAIMDALGVDRFATWGLSGGGPHALACAARAGDRVVACASMSGAAPADAPDLDFVAGMGEGNIHEFGRAREGEEALRPALEAEAAGLRGVTVPQFVEGMRPFLSDLDAAALDDDLGGYFLASFGEGLADGVDGWVDDDLAFVRAWGLEVSEIEIPVLVLQGRQDLMVPFAHGEWLARSIPGAESRLSETEGHLTLFANQTRAVHEWLLGQLAR